MKNILIALFLLGILTLTSCVSYLTPPMTGNNNIGYLPRPFFTDGVKSRSYILGEFGSSSPEGNLTLQMAMLNLSRGKTYKSINFGYGAFGFLGYANYKDLNDASFRNRTINDFNKGFYGVGIRTTLGFHKVSNNGYLNFRFLNWENAYSIEKGNYLQHRTSLFDGQRINGSETIYISKLSKIYTTGLSTEVLVNEALDEKNLELGFRIFFGFSPKLNGSFEELNSSFSQIKANSIAFQGSSFIKYKQLIINFQLSSEINSGAKFALGYTF